MPNLDGMGPQGQGSMTGGRKGRCRNVKAQNLQASRQTSETGEVLGVGRGGKPHGGGKGNRAGGSNRKGRRKSGN